jgi:hypothetical protein
VFLIDNPEFEVAALNGDTLQTHGPLGLLPVGEQNHSLPALAISQETHFYTPSHKVKPLEDLFNIPVIE